MEENTQTKSEEKDDQYNEKENNWIRNSLTEDKFESFMDTALPKVRKEFESSTEICSERIHALDSTSAQGAGDFENNNLGSGDNRDNNESSEVSDLKSQNFIEEGLLFAVVMVVMLLFEIGCVLEELIREIAANASEKQSFNENKDSNCSSRDMAADKVNERENGEVKSQTVLIHRVTLNGTSAAEEEVTMKSDVSLEENVTEYHDAKGSLGDISCHQASQKEWDTVFYDIKSPILTSTEKTSAEGYSGSVNTQLLEVIDKDFASSEKSLSSGQQSEIVPESVAMQQAGLVATELGSNRKSPSCVSISAVAMSTESAERNDTSLADESIDVKEGDPCRKSEMAEAFSSIRRLKEINEMLSKYLFKVNYSKEKLEKRNKNLLTELNRIAEGEVPPHTLEAAFQPTSYISDTVDSAERKLRSVLTSVKAVMANGDGAAGCSSSAKSIRPPLFFLPQWDLSDTTDSSSDFSNSRDDSDKTTPSLEVAPKSQDKRGKFSKCELQQKVESCSSGSKTTASQPIYESELVVKALGIQATALIDRIKGVEEAIQCEKENSSQVPEIREPSLEIPSKLSYCNQAKVEDKGLTGANIRRNAAKVNCGAVKSENEKMRLSEDTEDLSNLVNWLSVTLDSEEDFDSSVDVPQKVTMKLPCVYKRPLVSYDISSDDTASEYSFFKNSRLSDVDEPSAYPFNSSSTKKTIFEIPEFHEICERDEDSASLNFGESRSSALASQQPEEIFISDSSSASQYLPNLSMQHDTSGNSLTSRKQSQNFSQCNYGNEHKTQADEDSVKSASAAQEVKDDKPNRCRLLDHSVQDVSGEKIIKIGELPEGKTGQLTHDRGDYTIEKSGNAAEHIERIISPDLIISNAIESNELAVEATESFGNSDCQASNTSAIEYLSSSALEWPENDVHFAKRNQKIDFHLHCLENPTTEAPSIERALTTAATRIGKLYESAISTEKCIASQSCNSASIPRETSQQEPRILRSTLDDLRKSFHGYGQEVEAIAPLEHECISLKHLAASKVSVQSDVSGLKREEEETPARDGEVRLRAQNRSLSTDRLCAFGSGQNELISPQTPDKNPSSGVPHQVTKNVQSYVVSYDAKVSQSLQTVYSRINVSNADCALPHWKSASEMDVSRSLIMDREHITRCGDSKKCSSPGSSDIAVSANCLLALSNPGNEDDLMDDFTGYRFHGNILEKGVEGKKDHSPAGSKGLWSRFKRRIKNMVSGKGHKKPHREGNLGNNVA